MDLRTPIGLLFGALGLLLVGFGATHAGAAFTPTGVNINLDWGVVLVVFAAVMLGLAWRARGRKQKTTAEKPASTPASHSHS